MMRQRLARRLVHGLAVLLATFVPFGLAFPSSAAPAPRDGDRLPSPAAVSAPADGIRQIDWNALVPKDWDMKAGLGLSAERLAELDDADPKAMHALNALIQAGTRAPIVPSLDRARVRIAGFALPLDAVGKQPVRELLLVPYYGACIHTPPPPANQIIYVTLKTPIQGLRMMDAVWLSGQLHAATVESGMGMAGYTMDGASLTSFTAAR